MRWMGWTVLTLGLAAGASGAALADEIDMATVTCQDLLASNEQDGGAFLVWIHGFYGGQANDTTVNFEAFNQNMEALGKHCAEHPDISVMSAVKQVTGE